MIVHDVYLSAEQLVVKDLASYRGQHFSKRYDVLSPVMCISGEIHFGKDDMDLRATERVQLLMMC